MPRLTKKKYDQIRDLIVEGYTNIEIAEKTDVSEGTVSKQRKKLDGGGRSKPTIESDPKVHLSNDSIGKLYKIQGILGYKSLDETVEVIFNDYVIMMKEKFEFDPNFEKTPGDLFKIFKTKAKELDRIKKGRGDVEIQHEILDSLGIDEAILYYYYMEKEDGYPGDLIKFIGDNIIEYYTKVKGWSIPKTVEKVFKDPEDPAVKDFIIQTRKGRRQLN